MCQASTPPPPQQAEKASTKLKNTIVSCWGSPGDVVYLLPPAPPGRRDGITEQGGGAASHLFHLFSCMQPDIE